MVVAQKPAVATRAEKMLIGGQWRDAASGRTEFYHPRKVRTGVGVSTLAAGHKTLVPGIVAELRKQGGNDIVVFVGGVIPKQDYDFLYEAGVKGIYGPGTPILASAKDVLEQIRAALAKP